MFQNGKKNNVQLNDFHYAEGYFSMENAKDCRKAMLHGQWWDMFGDGTSKLKSFAIQVLSLTCSSYGCEHD